MTKYSTDLKEQMVRKLMPPSNRGVAAVSRETGISKLNLPSDDNHALLKLIREQEPESLNALAELSGRAPGNLRTAISPPTINWSRATTCWRSRHCCRSIAGG